MAKIKLEWVNGDYFSFQTEVPQTKKAFEREENKKINHRIKQLNRNQKCIELRQHGRIR